jgi:hypothetical protein
LPPCLQKQAFVLQMAAPKSASRMIREALLILI